MKASRSRLGLSAVVLFWICWLALSGTSRGTLDIQKRARDAGFKGDNCMYCHNEKFPKKGAVSHNDRGKWLIAEKEKRGAKEVDPAWLKDYPGDKK